MITLTDYIGQYLELCEMPELYYGNPNLRIGNLYRIIDVEGSNFWLIDDDGNEVSFYYKRFRI